MVFAHDTEFALQGAAALVNTMPGTLRDDSAGDRLTTPTALAAFLHTWSWTGSRDGSDAELDAVRSLRPRLRALWDSDEERRIDLVNELLREGEAMPQLVEHDGFGWHLHATSPSAPLATRMAVEAAMAFVDVIRNNEQGRLHVCEASDCDDVVIDLSRNRSRRFCDGGCGNRANVAAYRARRRGAAD